MATSYYPPSPASYYNPTTAVNPIGYKDTNDPRKLAQNERQRIMGQGDTFISNDQQQANDYLGQASNVQNYLNPIQSNLASGGGGYNPTETAAINLSPEDKENLIRSAGISAGARTASDVGAAERAAAAAGGNPAALATYRARASQTGAGAAADAMTQARAQAKQLESQGAQATGGARLAQQNEGLGYFGGLQGQHTQTGLAEQGLGQQAYQTETSGTNAAADTGLKASQTPTTSDKIIGGIAGAASAFLEDGSSGYLSDAVVGEGGPEAIIKNAPEAVQQAASDPVRSHTTFMADGDIGDGLPMASVDYGADSTPMGSVAPAAPWWQRVVGVANQGGQPHGAARPADAWNPTTPYQQLGQAIGGAAKMGIEHFADGGMPPEPQIITSPTHVRLEQDDMVVPLGYRPKAKVRPSAALPALAQRMRPTYGAIGA